MDGAASYSVTSWPRSAAVTAQASPAAPAPTTATRCLALGEGICRNSSSRPARGLTRQDVGWPVKMKSRQAWLQAMQVLMVSGRPAAALRTKSESARKGRAIDTMSASPLARMSSATSGALMRLLMISGMPMARLMRAAAKRKAARGTR